jgi:carbonic anhydrase
MTSTMRAPSGLVLLQNIFTGFQEFVAEELKEFHQDFKLDDREDDDIIVVVQGGCNEMRDVEIEQAFARSFSSIESLDVDPAAPRSVQRMSSPCEEYQAERENARMREKEEHFQIRKDRQYEVRKANQRLRRKPSYKAESAQDLWVSLSGLSLGGEQAKTEKKPRWQAMKPSQAKTSSWK